MYRGQEHNRIGLLKFQGHFKFFASESYLVAFGMSDYAYLDTYFVKISEP